MKILKKGKQCLILLVLSLLMAAACLFGCGKKEAAEDKIQDLEFTVVGQNEVPQELQEIIEQKKREPFRLTYTSGQDLYIAAGYGEQKTGGYSITVPELYLTENSITIRTELEGPEQGAQTGSEPSYPYVVVRMEFMEQPVVFK